MNNKAQINQVFTIIFVIIIMATIVIFAVKGIGGILTNKCEADFISFKTDFNNLILRNKDFGRIEKHVLFAPCSYYKLCVINKDANVIDANEDEELLNGALESAISDGKVVNNIYLFDGDKAVPLGYSEFIGDIFNESEENVDYYCLSQKSGRFTFITEGKGRTIEFIFHSIDPTD